MSDMFNENRADTSLEEFCRACFDWNRAHMNSMCWLRCT